MDFGRLFTPEDVAAGVPEHELKQAATTGTGNDDRWMVRRDFTRFWASGTTSGLRNAAGQVVAFTKVMRDLTERKRGEDALKEADRAKDEFLALLAHELRNPLAPLRTALEILRVPGASPDAMNRTREMMTRQLGNMVRLIDDLLDVGRITRGRVELRRERVALDSVLDLAVETSRPLIEAARHELIRTGPAKPVFLDADATRISQVVANLLNNAAKYMPDGGKIWLTSEAVRDGSEVVIRVRDNGVGIAPDMLPRVWGLFTQADRTLGRTQGGLGIGLTLVKSLIEMHGGSVEAHSAGLGHGSEFVVRLPTAPPPEALAGTATRPSGPGRSLQILVVDDNVDGADSLQTLLCLQGHDARTAYDGPAALALAAEFCPEVVFLDIGLPGIDGYEVARRLRTQPGLAGTRLIALTGWGQDADRERSRQAGFDTHLVKPVDPTQLQSVLSLGATGT
jgi:signal transduction histidine kinase